MSILDLARPEIVAMRPYSSARSEAGAVGALLNANELPWPLIDDPLASDGVEPLNRYPQPQHAELVSRVAERHELPENHVLLTRGSDDGIDLLVRVFCRAGIDAVLDTPPGFGMYRIAAQVQGAGIVNIPRHPGSLALDTGAILAALRDSHPPRIAFLTSPANPTGDLVEPDFLEQALEVSRGRSLVVVDEAYAEFSDTPGCCARIGSNPHLVILRTLSKAFGSAGLRCGAVLAQAEVIDLLRRVIPPYPLPTPVLSLALQLFEPETLARQQDLLDQVRTNKARLIAAVEGRAFVRRLWPGEANFVLLRVTDARALLGHCARRGIVIRGFAGSPHLADCVRITVGSREEIDLLARALDVFVDPAAAEVAGG